jgi:FtsP/CotA-like multicopper oxidase with cupredoxin domain
MTALYPFPVLNPGTPSWLSCKSKLLLTSERTVMSTRRTFLQRAAAFGGGLLAIPKLIAAQNHSHTRSSAKPEFMRSRPEDAALAVETPDIADLPFRLDNGIKEFHLIAEPVKQELIPGKTVDLWGFNGSAPGPTIQVDQGDRVRILVDNHLPEPFSMHWHGFEIPHAMDGAPGTSQDPIQPGGRFVYEFTLHQEGTFFYHSHMAMQEMMGMLGAFILHPRQAHQPRVDRDFALLLQEYAVLPNNTTPNSMNMEFNWLTLNGKVGPATTPLIVKLGDRVRIRMINLGMDHHPMHLHGHTFAVTGTEAGRQPQAIWGPANTVLVGVAQARDIEFVANNPGDWMLHCHLPHHMMNQMSSMVGPMSRRPGMPMGMGMEEGMGMIRKGNALSDDNGPSLGRGMGVGSTNEQRLANGQQSGKEAMEHNEPELPQTANSVPGFPQDAFMEGPMMAMDKMVEKPENYGLRPGWSGFMQGMMTFVRVLPPDLYEKIMTMRGQQEKQRPKPMPPMEHHQEASLKDSVTEPQPKTKIHHGDTEKTKTLKSQGNRSFYGCEAEEKSSQTATSLMDSNAEGAKEPGETKELRGLPWGRI